MNCRTCGVRHRHVGLQISVCDLGKYEPHEEVVVSCPIKASAVLAVRRELVGLCPVRAVHQLPVSPRCPDPSPRSAMVLGVAVSWTEAVADYFQSITALSLDGLFTSPSASISG